jgi:hypothetical protein
MVAQKTGVLALAVHPGCVRTEVGLWVHMIICGFGGNICLFVYNNVGLYVWVGEAACAPR